MNLNYPTEYHGDPLPERVYAVGETWVFEDRNGPYKFVRDGKEVGCICDPDTSTVCLIHGTLRAGMVAANLFREDQGGD